MNKSRLIIAMCVTAGSLLIAPTAWAMSAYSQDFEGIIQSDPLALGNAGWLAWGNIYDTGGTLLYSHGAHPAPNNQGIPPAFSDIVSGQGGAGQGNQQLSVFSDYENGDHGVGNLIESIVYQEQTIGAGDIGTTWAFSFDAMPGNIELGSTASAFIRVIDSLTGDQWREQVLDMTSIPSAWQEGLTILTPDFDSGMVGALLQFGFANIATNYEGSSIYYDNIAFNPVPIPAAIWLFGSGLIGLAGIARKKAT